MSERLSSSHAILQLLQEEMMTLFPAFPEAFGQLDYVSCPELNCTFGTDGLHLFYQPYLLLHGFLENSELLKRSYLHVYLHCLCLHMIQKKTAGYDCTSESYARLWDTACDLSVRLLSARLEPTRENREFLKTASGLLGRSEWLTPEQILTVMIQNDLAASDHSAASSSADKNKKILQLADSCALDSHRFWLRKLSAADAMSIGAETNCKGKSSAASLSTDQLHYLEQLQQIWQNKLPKIQNAALTGQRQGQGSFLTEEANLKQRDEWDYRKFLRQFAVPREEALLDMDSFDYIPYHYGLEYYSNMPFIEPLEYREVNRLDELAIAIDTSGSCSGKIVRRFLEETWTILRQRENFFAKMRLHLIQCDCMIQEHRIFTSVEEWEAAIPTLQIHGHGNTDFCPVFHYLDKLIQKKEIRHLRGLLYFTDGDGIFPTSPPAWDTAFVFLNDQTEKHAIPDWAIRLNLHLPEDF